LKLPRRREPQKDGSLKGTYAQSWPELADKLIQCLMSSRTALWEATGLLMAALFLLDNWRGELECWRDLVWTTAKCLVFAGLCWSPILVGHLRAILRKCREPQKKSDPA